MSALINTTTVKAGYEELGGDGSYGFSTPLATLHAFQGWTDRFLSTPPEGIRDLFFTLSIPLTAGKLESVYHRFSSDHGDFDYGTEIGVSAQKTYFETYTFGVKYATYKANSHPKNTGPPSLNAEKLWFTAQVKF